MNESTKKHGGSRNGAGRHKADALTKKRAISIRLPEWLILWMDEQPSTNRAVLIEEALKQAHKIEAPNAEL